MPTPDLSPEISGHDTKALTPRQRWTLALAGAFLGAVIGPTGFLLQMRLATYQSTGSDLMVFPGPPARWAKNLHLLASLAGMQVFLVCAFGATLLLTPSLIRWLEGRVGRSRTSYYTGAAAGGVVLGVVATFLVAWALALTALVVGASTGASDASGGATALGMLGGVLVFGPLVGLFAPFFFIVPIVGAGVPFGLLYGVAVRRAGRGSGLRSGQLSALGSQ
jgi:hypothetical protein